MAVPEDLQDQCSGVHSVAEAFHREVAEDLEVAEVLAALAEVVLVVAVQAEAGNRFLFL